MRQLLLTHIRKIKNNKQIFIILFLLSPIIIAATNNPLLVFFPYLVSMHLFSGITKVERKEGIKQGEDILLNSLPVSRKEIVAEIKSYTGRPYLKFRRPEGDLQEAQAKLQETWEKICDQLEDLEKAFWAIFPKLNGQTY